MPILGLCYLVSPYDISPDFMMGIGWIDDLIVLWLLWRFFQRFLAQRNAYRQYGQQNGSFSQSKGSGQSEREDFSRQTVNPSDHQKDPYRVLGVSRGATTEEIKSHIENQFEDGWNWENKGDVWEIDHIRPYSSFDLTDDKQYRECCNYKNIRPLSVKENRTRVKRTKKL